MGWSIGVLVYGKDMTRFVDRRNPLPIETGKLDAIRKTGSSLRSSTVLHLRRIDPITVADPIYKSSTFLKTHVRFFPDEAMKHLFPAIDTLSLIVLALFHALILATGIQRLPWTMGFRHTLPRF
jgi:hypothetical protein